MADNDFVERLRIRWETMGDMANDERAAAADEIEFLRRSQRELMAKVATARAERDEARREVCQLMRPDEYNEPFDGTVFDYAAHRGWDCFKENIDG